MNYKEAACLSTFTDLEKRILRIVGEKRLPIDQLAAEAGCRPETIYKRMQNKPEFSEAFNEMMLMGVRGHLPAVLDAFIAEALAGSFSHGKLLLEIGGVYQKKQQVDAQISVRDDGPVFKSDREKWEFLKATFDEKPEEDK